MIFKVKPIENSLIQQALDEGMELLSDFYNIKSIGYEPDILIVNSRKEIDKIRGKKTEDWVIGWGRKHTIFVLDFDKIHVESRHKMSEKDYQRLIIHELCHIFTGSSAKGTPLPMWLNEGISIYLAGQLGMNKKPEKFTGFLESSMENHKPAYIEGGYVVELLVKYFGKEKLIDWIRDFKNRSFKDVYGFDLTYENINNLYTGQEISKNEALDKFKELIGKPYQFRVKHDGSLEFKFPNYLLSIERKWDIWNGKEEYHSYDFISLKDEEKIEKFIGKNKLIGIDTAKDKIFELFFENGIELSITESNFDSGFFFKLVSHKSNEPILIVTSTFKFILLPENLK